MQQRLGSDKLAVVLIDVDPEYYKDSNEYLPQAKMIMEKKKLACPNVIARRGFSDVVRTFNVSGYGNIIIDPEGIVRGVNVHGEELERMMDEILHLKKKERKGKGK